MLRTHCTRVLSTSTSVLSGPLFLCLSRMFSTSRQQVQSRTYRGIFNGVHIAFGNQVSHSERKTRRSWKPNILKKTIFSQVLNKNINIQLSTRALRTFDKYGGLDRFLLRTPLHRLDLGFSRTLRTRLELTLRDNLPLASVLHLEDVYSRLQRSSERARLNDILDTPEWANYQLENTGNTCNIEKPRTKSRSDHNSLSSSASSPSSSSNSSSSPPNAALLPELSPPGRGNHYLRSKRATFKWPFTQPRYQTKQHINKQDPAPIDNNSA